VFGMDRFHVLGVPSTDTEVTVEGAVHAQRVFEVGYSYNYKGTFTVDKRDINLVFDDDNNVYSATLLGHGFKITETSENGTPDILNFTLEADEETDQIVLNDTSDVTSKTKVVKISHATIARSDDSVATAISQGSADVTDYDYSTVTTVTPVTGITTNNGHITQVHTTPINLIDTNASVKEVALSVSQDPTDVNKEKATLKTKVTLEHPSQPDATTDYKDDSVTFTSLNKNIQISTDANGITINLVWGTF
jgi:hypothetical protein